MSEECTHDCSSCGSSCPDRPATQPTDFLEKPQKLTHVKKIYGVVSGKGGVGKSLVTSMLATLSCRRGNKTAILDADVTGPSIPMAFGVHEHAYGDENGILPCVSKMGVSIMSLNLLTERETDPVVWRGPVIAGMVKQFWTDVIWGDVDIMFIDMPPGTGDVPLTVFQSIPIDGVIVVTTPQELVGMIVEKAVRMAGMLHIPVLGIVENMSYISCPDCGKRIPIFGESRIEDVAEKLSIKTVAKLPIDPALTKLTDKGMIELFEGNWLDGMMNMLEDR